MQRLPFTLVTLFVFLLALISGCKDRSQPKGTNKSRPAPAATSKKVKKNQPAAREKDDDHHPHPKGPTKVTFTSGKTRTTKAGKKVYHLGLEFKEKTPEVTVAQLLAAPKKWEGKRVVMKGNIAGMCHKRRRWFALVDPKTGKHIRLFTVPNFLVPAGSMGKSVRAAGRVVKIEIPAARARHMAKVHKLGDPKAITGKTHKEIVVRVNVAELW